MSIKTWSKEDLKNIKEYELECFEYDVVSKIKMWREFGVNHKLNNTEMFQYSKLKNELEQLNN